MSFMNCVGNRNFIMKSDRIMQAPYFLGSVSLARSRVQFKVAIRIHANENVSMSQFELKENILLLNANPLDISLIL